jgi:uncharacterized membrane protein YtjA (UPF0391 family)
LDWESCFLILTVIAAILGASGVAGISMQIAKWLVIIFVVLAWSPSYFVLAWSPSY